MTRRRRIAGALAAAFVLAGAAPASLATAPISRLDTPWWRARHEAKLAEARRGPVDLVFLGDSITQYYEREGPPPGDYAAVWKHFYGDRHALNLGFSGDATSHLLWRIEHGEIDGLAPKAAVILIGANNLGALHWPADADVAGIERVVDETRRRLPRARILLLGVLPSDRGPWVRQTSATINRALSTRFDGGGVAGVTFLDVSHLFLRDGAIDRSLYIDPLQTPPVPALHPSAVGMARIASAIEPTLAGLLGDRVHTP